jgi:hypothetical protein
MGTVLEGTEGKELEGREKGVERWKGEVEKEWREERENRTENGNLEEQGRDKRNHRRCSWAWKKEFSRYVNLSLLNLNIWYTHKTSGFKTSGFKTSGFKTSGFKTSGFKTSGFKTSSF